MGDSRASTSTSGASRSEGCTKGDQITVLSSTLSRCGQGPVGKSSIRLLRGLAEVLDDPSGPLDVVGHDRAV